MKGPCENKKYAPWNLWRSPELQNVYQQWSFLSCSWILYDARWGIPVLLILSCRKAVWLVDDAIITTQTSTSLSGTHPSWMSPGTLHHLQRMPWKGADSKTCHIIDLGESCLALQINHNDNFLVFDYPLYSLSWGRRTSDILSYFGCLQLQIMWQSVIICIMRYLYSTLSIRQLTLDRTHT